jgi:hypothetical protein
MTSVTLLTIEIILSIATSLVIMWLMAQPLKSALVDLCPTEKQANFWFAYTRVMLLITPLLFVLFTNARHTGDTLSDLRSALMAVLAGLLAGLIVVGRKMYIPVDRQVNSLVGGDKA